MPNAKLDSQPDENPWHTVERSVKEQESQDREGIFCSCRHIQKELPSPQERVTEPTREEAQVIFSDLTTLRVKLRRDRGDRHGKSDNHVAWARAIGFVLHAKESKTVE